MIDLSWHDLNRRFVVLSDDLTGKVRVFLFNSESVTVCNAVCAVGMIGFSSLSFQPKFLLAIYRSSDA